MARHPGPQGRVGTARCSVHLLEGQSAGGAHLDAVHDGVAEQVGEEARSALVGRRNVGWRDPHAAELEIALVAEGRINGQDLAAADSADGTTLCDLAAHRSERDVPAHLFLDQCVGEVLAGRPHRLASRRRLQRDEGRPEPASAEEEVPRCRQLPRDQHAPVQVVPVGLHAQEGPCVHGGAPYWRRPPFRTGGLVGSGGLRLRVPEGPMARSAREVGVPRGCSSAGRAAALQAVGRGFESLHLHDVVGKTTLSLFRRGISSAFADRAHADVRTPGKSHSDHSQTPCDRDRGQYDEEQAAKTPMARPRIEPAPVALDVGEDRLRHARPGRSPATLLTVRDGPVR